MSPRPLPHALCGLPPRVYGMRVVCPTCFDVCQSTSTKKAVEEWNKTQASHLAMKQLQQEAQQQGHY